MTIIQAAIIVIIIIAVIALMTIIANKLAEGSARRCQRLRGRLNVLERMASRAKSENSDMIIAGMVENKKVGFIASPEGLFRLNLNIDDLKSEHDANPLTWIDLADDLLDKAAAGKIKIESMKTIG